MTSETLPAEPARRRVYVRYAVALVRTILARVADGEGLAAICKEPGMPSRNSVSRWAREHPRIGAALDRAREAAGRTGMGGAPRRYCPVTAQEIFGRLAQGESLAAICADPAMPAATTVTRWRRWNADFDLAMKVAREAHAEKLCDESLAMMRAVTPQTAYATHVALTHIRWMTTVRAPQLFGAVKAMEAPKEKRFPDILLRHFKVETREDGMTRMVSYVAHPKTGGVVRDHEGEWGTPSPSNQVKTWKDAGSASAPKADARGERPGSEWL